MASPLAELVAPENPQTRRTREWRERRQTKAAYDRYAGLVRLGILSAQDAAAEVEGLAPVPEPVRLVAEPDPPPPRNCRWIEGQHERFTDPCYCGRPSLLGKAWCQKHAERVFLAAE